VQESEAASEMDVYYVANPSLNPKYTPSGVIPSVSDATFRRLGRMVTDHIGASENIFVHDAAIGSHRLGEVNVRVITNSANVNLYLKHMLPKQSHSETIDFPYQYTVYIAPDLKVLDAASMGLKPSSTSSTTTTTPTSSSSSSSFSSSSSSSGPSFSVSHLERAITIIAGTNSNQAIKDAIVASISSRLIQDPIPSLGLNASIVVSKQGKSSSLVIDPSNLLGELRLVPATPTSTATATATPTADQSTAKKGEKKTSTSSSSSSSQQQHLFTAHLPDGVVGLAGAFWNHYGVYRMFQGITHKNQKVPRQRADLVEHVKSDDDKLVETLITQPLKDLPLESPVPSALVFLIKDGNALLPSLSKLSLSQASKVLSVGYNGSSIEKLTPYFHSRSIVSQPGQVDKIFQELASLHKTNFYLVNTQRKDGSTLSPTEIDTIISAATEGRLESAKTVKDSVFDFQTIQQLDGVSSPLDITQGWQKQDYTSQAKKLATIFSL
jgi:hypothetical protein